MSTAEVTDIQVKNATDGSSPLSYSCHIKVPAYGQRTGTRIFFQPGLFEFNSQPLFSANERKFPLYWSFPFTEDDTVEITLPPGYELDNAESPGTAGVTNFMVNDIKMAYAPTDRTLLYKRHMAFAQNNNLMLPVKSYSDLKKVLDRFHEQDTHLISVKQTAGNQR